MLGEGSYILAALQNQSIELLIDSGAFTAYNTGTVITLDDYCQFLTNMRQHGDFRYVQLDVFGDPQGTFDNYIEMRNQGFTEAIPVFTRGDSLERLDELYSYTDYIMFGGIVIGTGNREYIKWFLENNHGRSCHWLGFVDMPFIKAYRPTSVDSSSWNCSARFGTIPSYAGNGNLQSFKKTEKQRAAHYYQKESVYDLLVNCETSAKDWFSMGAYPHIHRAYDVQQGIGTKIYQAIAGDNQIEAFSRSLRRFKGEIT